jgi:AraC-like DNA-binding protein
LNNFGECFIYHEGFQPTHLIDRFLPDGNVEIIIDLDSKPKFIYGNETLKEIQSVCRVWASGVRTEPISIGSGKDSSMMIIAFKRGMAYPFFPFPMNEIVDCVVEADLIWGHDFMILREQIIENRDSLKKFHLAEKFLIKQFIDKCSFNPCIQFALNQIIKYPNQITLNKLSNKIGYSQKHFISLFKRQVGITPKSYLKLMRFQKTINEIEKFTKIDWTLISHDCGFYDQAHFINDFKLFSGFTPEEYFKRRSSYLNYVPIK